MAKTLELLEVFKQFLKANKYSKATKESYISDISLFLSYLNNKSMDITDAKKISTKDVYGYIIHLQREDKSSATIARSISSLKTLFKMLVRENYVSKDITYNLKTPTIERTTKDVLSIEEIDTLLSIPTTDTPLGIRDKAILEVLYATGIRITELTTLSLSQVYLELGYLQCGKEERIIPFGETATNILELYLEKARPELLVDEEEDTVFLNYQGHPMTRQGYWKLVKSYGEKADLELTPQLIRNSFASHMLKAGANPHSLKEILGTKDLSFLADLEGTETNLKEVFRQNHPRP